MNLSEPNFTVAHTNALRDALETAKITARRSYTLAWEARADTARASRHIRRYDAAVAVSVHLTKSLADYRELVAYACAPWFEVAEYRAEHLPTEPAEIARVSA